MVMQGRRQKWQGKLGMWDKFWLADEAQQFEARAKEAGHHFGRDKRGKPFQHKRSSDHQERYFVAREDRHHGEDAAQAQRATITHVYFGAPFRFAAPRRPRGGPVQRQEA